MTDPAQDLAARRALEATAGVLGVDVPELVVREIVRRRRRGSKQPFYYVTIEGPRGDHFRYQVSDGGARVEREPG